MQNIEEIVVNCPACRMSDVWHDVEVGVHHDRDCRACGKSLHVYFEISVNEDGE